jgi:thiamine kinase-like enzyme
LWEIRYHDLFNAHHAIGGNRDLFYHILATHPAMADCRESIDYLTDQIRELEGKLESFREWQLPVQIIHGDLHYDNVMVIGDTVSGLLDFEFCALDWRAMELAGAFLIYSCHSICFLRCPICYISKFLTDSIVD